MLDSSIVVDAPRKSETDKPQQRPSLPLPCHFTIPLVELRHADGDEVANQT